MKKIQLILFLCLTHLLINAQNYFSNDYSNDSRGIRLTTLAVNADGSYFASGNTFSTTTATSIPLIVKFDVNGGILWQKSFDLIPNGVIHDIKINKDGDCVAVFKHTSGFGTMKISAAGAVIWSKMYTCPADVSFASAPYTKYSLSLSATNQLFVNTSEFTMNSILYRISDDDGVGDGDHDGNDDEDNDGDNNDDGGDVDTSIVIDDSTSAGKIPTMCMTICDDDTSVIIVGKDNDDCFLLRVGASGNVIWSKVYNDNFTTSYLRIKSIIQLKDGNYLMAGLYSLSYGSMYDKGIIMKINKNGSLLWSKTYNEPVGGNPIDFEKIVQTENGKIFVIGSDFNSAAYEYIPFMMEIAANGSTVSSILLSTRPITGVAFPTAYLDAATDHDNILALSTYVANTYGVSYVNKSDAFNHVACSANNLGLIAADLDMSTVPSRPLSSIHANPNTVTVSTFVNTATNMDMGMHVNCRMGTFTAANQINSIHSIPLNTYPNPAINMVQFDLDYSGQAIINVFDINGKVVLNKVLSENTINVATFASGLYHFVINANEQSYSGKFMK